MPRQGPCLGPSAVSIHTSSRDLGGAGCYSKDSLSDGDAEPNLGGHKKPQVKGKHHGHILGSEGARHSPGRQASWGSSQVPSSRQRMMGERRGAKPCRHWYRAVEPIS